MNQPLFRAIRFTHPIAGDDTPEAGFGLDAKNQIDCVDGPASVRQAILLLLSTAPGERVMRPTYGCDLNRLAFAVNDETTAGLAIHYVRQAIERWEPRVALLNVDAVRDPEEDSRLNIFITYRVRRTVNVVQLNFPILLSGEA
ncbi:MAG TPA: GPW/gp25 family protein [Polyangiaceae bacterium]|jgi:hypothetical protein|nr:GPW/gp25 family protein [Polyangiaceae bacterium]